MEYPHTSEEKQERRGAEQIAGMRKSPCTSSTGESIQRSGILQGDGDVIVANENFINDKRKIISGLGVFGIM